jgi:hypothetical protein
MADMSEFWASGGAITPAAWAEKEAREQAEDAEHERRAEELRRIEAMPLAEWLGLDAATMTALCERWGGFTPPARVTSSDLARRKDAR